MRRGGAGGRALLDMPGVRARAGRRVKRALPRLALPFAPLLVVRRPLAPFSNYTFGAPEPTSPAAKTRERVWRYLRERGKTKRLVSSWYEGLKVEQHLGDDQSRCLFVSGCFEPNELFFLSGHLREGMVFIDVGANQGLFTLLASRRVGQVGRVLAVEPSERELQYLQRNLELNHVTNVTVNAVALGEESGTAILHVANREHGGHNTLGSFVYDDVMNVEDAAVEVATLDSIVEEAKLGRVDLVKLDAEGAELAILRGGRGTLDKHRPVLLIEVQDASLRHLGSSAGELLSFLQAQGYGLHEFSTRDGLLQPVTGKPTSLNIVGLPN